MAALRDVRRAVADWRAMEANAVEAEQALPEWARGVDGEWLEECRAFLRWLLDDHFIFLGVRDYRVVRGKKNYELQLVQGSGLGILRETDDTITLAPADEPGRSGPQAQSEIAADHHQDQRALDRAPRRLSRLHWRFEVRQAGSHHRRAPLSGPVHFRCLQPGRDGYASGARAEPGMSWIAVGLVRGSHAWKSMVHILETLPREELLQASSAELRETAVGVLQSAGTSASSPVHPEGTLRSFLFLPGVHAAGTFQYRKPRRNSEHPVPCAEGFAPGLLGECFRIGAGPPARHRSATARRRGEFRCSALEQKIVEVVRSWTDELRSILVEKLGEEMGLKYAARFGKAFPEAYKEDVSPWVAAFDVENAAAVDDGEPLRMSLYRPRKRRGGIIRFKLFRKGSPIPLSHVLPMLENLGLHIVSERPYELHLPGDERLWIQDFDMIPA